MAAIKEYNSTLADSGLSPSQQGISALDQTASQAVSTGSRIRQSLDEEGKVIGSGIDAAGSAAGAIYKQMVEQPDINQLATQQARTLQNITDAWDAQKKAANLDDPDIAKKFLDDELTQNLNDFVDGAKTPAGKQFAFDQAVLMQQHMFKQTTADVATRIGQSVTIGLDETKSTLSNMVRKDPSSFDTVVAMWNNSLKARIASSPGLDAATAAKVETDLKEHGLTEFANAAILGAAAKDPAAATAMLNSGKYDKWIDGTQTANMIKNMEYAGRATQNFQRAEETRQKQEVSDKAVLDYELKSRTDPKSVSATAALQDPKLTRTDAVYIAKMIDREAKPEAIAKVSNAYESALYGRIYAGDNDPNKIDDGKTIRDEYIAGHLTPTARDNLLKQLDERKTPEGIAWTSRLAPLLKVVEIGTKSNPLMQGTDAFDPAGPENAYRFQVDLEAKKKAYITANKNQLDLLDPSKPDYVWSPKARAPYLHTMNESMAAGRARLQSDTTAPDATPKDVPPSLKDYPDAKRAVDGKYHVMRDGKWYTVE